MPTQLGMSKVISLLLKYFALTGLAAHLLLVGLILFMPELTKKAYYKGMSRIEPALRLLPRGNAADQGYSLQEELQKNFEPWAPLQEGTVMPRGAYIGSRKFTSLQAAGKALRDGDTLLIGAGVYSEPLVITRNRVTVMGAGHVVIEKTAAQGKAAIVNLGNDNHIKNIECRHIAVRDGNGACVRQAGKNLKLTHVYFHNSQQGILTGARPGKTEIIDSRFEILGAGGQAHGIYVGGGQLVLRQSMFLAAKGEGHEIKSRASSTLIDRCIVASFSSKDSRLIDITGGGVLIISNSILEQGPGSVNQDLIGYGLESRSYAINRVELMDNIILMERQRGNVLFHRHADLPDPVARNNLLVGKADMNLTGFNVEFTGRREAGLAAYPLLPRREGVGVW